MNLSTPLFALLVIGLISCNNTDNKETKVQSSTNKFFNPPVNGVDVPYKEYAVDASKGDTLYYSSGSIILFPPNSFVDKEGNVINGNVQVKYREFLNPIDFYLSGIPMNYDSLGQPYTFESSGMCEILAFKDGMPVFVNPASQPEINLASNSNAKDHNIYYLDTVQRKWIYQGSSIVTELNNPEVKFQPSITAVSEELIAPLKPEKANNKSPVIRIIIDTASYKELLVYDNLQFQLEADENNFSPKDTLVEWNKIELLKGNKNGLYTVRLTNINRTVSYSARPVLEGVDYDKALIIFNEKNEEYNRLKKKRVTQEMKDKGMYIIDSIAYVKTLEQNKRTEKLNRLIEARNLVIKKQNEAISAINEGRNVYRTFTVNRFGIWNCDVPVRPSLIPITATFINEKGVITLENISVFCKRFNIILTYHDNNISIVNNSDNMIVGSVNGAFAYLSYEDFKKLEINQNTKQQIFFMTVLSVKENNYENIRAISVRE